MFELQPVKFEDAVSVHIEVFQTGFNSGEWLEDFDTRIVEIPIDEYNSCKHSDELLNLVYKYGQNEFQPQETYSVSVGDLICLPTAGKYAIDYKYFAVSSFGFKLIDTKDLQDFFDLNQFERSIGSFAKGK